MVTQRMKDFTVAPLTAERWGDMEKLFGPWGACGGCWCMWWRITRTEFSRRKGLSNRHAFRRLVKAGHVPGLLAYAGGEPIGWCALGPRDTFPALDRSRVLKRIDEVPVWSVVCFFVSKPFRRQGVTGRLLRAAVKFARSRGARIVEGYPIDPKSRTYPEIFAFTGLVSTFRGTGFVEVARRSRGRPIMRYGGAVPDSTGQPRAHRPHARLRID